MLLAAGADASLASDHGTTALVLAAAKGAVAVVAAIQAHRAAAGTAAGTAAAEDDAELALRTAQHVGHDDIVAMLRPAVDKAAGATSATHSTTPNVLHQTRDAADTDASTNTGSAAATGASLYAAQQAAQGRRFQQLCFFGAAAFLVLVLMFLCVQWARRRRVRAFVVRTYEAHAPGKIKDVDALMVQFAGREEELRGLVYAKYVRGGGQNTKKRK